MAKEPSKSYFISSNYCITTECAKKFLIPLIRTRSPDLNLLRKTYSIGFDAILAFSTEVYGNFLKKPRAAFHLCIKLML